MATRDRKPESGRFATTQWSIVLEAAGDDEAKKTKALTQLCSAYWYPIYSFIRRKGYSQHDSEDLTQSFFAFLIEKNGFKKIDPERGRFRAYILTATKNFLADQLKRARTIKRGGLAAIIPIHTEEGEARLAMELKEDLSPDKQFDRTWASTLLERVMKTLEDEQKRVGRSHLFERLRPHVSKESDQSSYAQIASELGKSVDVIRKSVQRLRKRYGILLRDEVLHTVASPDQIDEEVEGLFQAWQ